MRPTVEVADAREYECLACGARVENPSGGVCRECGSVLRSLGRERDL